MPSFAIDRATRYVYWRFHPRRDAGGNIGRSLGRSSLTSRIQLHYIRTRQWQRVSPTLRRRLTDSAGSPSGRHPFDVSAKSASIITA